MSRPKTLDVTFNVSAMAFCFSCGTRCYAVDRKSRMGRLKWSKPDLLHYLRVGKEDQMILIHLCDPCLRELGRRIDSAINWRAVKR